MTRSEFDPGAQQAFGKVPDVFEPADRRSVPLVPDPITPHDEQALPEPNTHVAVVGDWVHASSCRSIRPAYRTPSGALVEPEIFALNARIEDRHWWFRARRTILLDLATPMLPAGGTVLDVGCGTGGNIAAFPEACTRIGVDPSADAVSLAREIRPGVSFFRGMVPDAVEEELGRADVVLLTDVLEHVEADGALLSDVVRGMKPGAHLVLTVPADPGLWSPHDVAHHHCRRYEAHQLQALWADLPVDPLLVAPMNRRLHPLVWGVRSVTRRLGRASGRSDTDLAVPNAFANAILYRIFAGESKRLVRAMSGQARPPRGRGVSLVAVLRRIDSAPEHGASS